MATLPGTKQDGWIITFSESFSAAYHTSPECGCHCGHLLPDSAYAEFNNHISHFFLNPQKWTENPLLAHYLAPTFLMADRAGNKIFTTALFLFKGINMSFCTVVGALTWGLQWTQCGLEWHSTTTGGLCPSSMWIWNNTCTPSSVTSEITCTPASAWTTQEHLQYTTA